MLQKTEQAHVVIWVVENLTLALEEGLCYSKVAQILIPVKEVNILTFAGKDLHRGKESPV